MNRTTTTTAATARTIDRSEELLDRAQRVVDSLTRLLDDRSPALARPVSAELMDDLLAVLPARSSTKGCCSL